MTMDANVWAGARKSERWAAPQVRQRLTDAGQQLQ